ncbi:hypothetical protein FOA52_011224 [Chlamydomonas sp. UWO 241]|nr:hypothetical protein FOA52_011224 [Chlamydomonas sp. UWO 241]
MLLAALAASGPALPPLNSCVALTCVLRLLQGSPAWGFHVQRCMVHSGVHLLSSCSPAPQQHGELERGMHSARHLLASCSPACEAAWAPQGAGAHTRAARGYATAPPRDRIRVIPFLLTQEQADAAYTAYHQQPNNPFLAPMRHYERAKEVFLPFWALSGAAEVTAVSATVTYQDKGRTHSFTEYINRTWERHYSPEELQIYAGSKYDRADVEAVQPGPQLVHARKPEPGMMDESAGGVDGALRKVYPYTLTPDGAMERVPEVIRAKEQASVEAIVRSMHPRAQQVSGVTVTVSLLPGFSASPIYVPVFVFTLKSPMLGLKMRTFLGAVPGAPVSGTRTYDGLKVGSFAAAAAPVVLLLLGIAMPWTRLFWIGAVLPGAAAGIGAHFFADARAWWQGRALAGKEARSEQVHGNWDAEWVRGLGDDAGRRARQQQQQQQQRGSGGRARSHGFDTFGGPGDPQGYYKVLGVPRNASTSDIQAAYRAAAFKYHPDHSKLEKASATEAFTYVQSAYSTLRDPKRRARYDAGMVS